MRNRFSFRSIRKCLKFITIVLLVCIYTTYINYVQNSTKLKHPNPVNLQYVTVHIDLKGAPPKMEFMKIMLPELKKLGANALLMEYEDMFPYQNQLWNLSKPQHYSRNELKQFLEEANNLGLEIIPLVQTFGHMEFVLKLTEFKHLRENPKFVDSICPSRWKTLVLIYGMLKQVIEFHNSVVPLKHIHIGCDEVYRINTCEDCKKRRLSSYDIYVDHVNIVTNMVLNLSPNTTILIWDDMMRSRVSQWKGFKINPKVELVYWLYGNIPKSTHTSMYFYHKHNIRNIWIASAFKGAEHENSVVPNYEKRTRNTLAWLKLANNYVFAGEDKVYSFKGIVLTGWSRHKHFKPLCELLPVSYKSLITSLLLVNKYKNGSRIADIDWKEDWDTIFNNHFLTDYYVQVGCKGLVVNSCILKPANSLFNSVTSHEKLLKAIRGIKKLSINKTCNITQNVITYHKSILASEDDLRSKMTPFYSSEIQNEFFDVRRNSTKVYSYLIRACPESFGSPHLPKRQNKKKIGRLKKKGMSAP